MGELFVLEAADSLLGKLASYAYEQASRVNGVYDDLQGIRDTLSIVRGLLLDAEEKKDQKHGLREWLRQIRNICSDAEDVFDGFECQNTREQVVEASGSIMMKVDHFFSNNQLAFRLRMAREIKDVRDRLDKVAADGFRFGLTTMNVEPMPLMQRREMTYSHVDAPSVIGRENDKEEIIKLLMQPPHPDGDQSVCVVPIVGIGGLGKTTLAKLVFNDKRMDRLFQLKMWVCVLDDFDVRQLIIKIINSASTSTPDIALPHQENINRLDIEQLVSLLKNKLSGQKYLLVLDDVWNFDRDKWIELKGLIKVGAVGSKIIMTTRRKSIDSMMDSTIPAYVLKGLSVDDCLSLFVKWAFKEGEEIKYPNLVEVGKEIVKKCKGVPLAVRTLARSLFSKFDLNKWEFVRDHEIWNVEQKEGDILPALKLSYDQMPSYLRHCFAYFSLYPKDYTFYSDSITNFLWLALGLVQSLDETLKPEDVARQYIDELHSRSFLEDFEDFGPFCMFTLHGLVHDLAMYVAEEECLLLDSQTRNISEQARHISIIENDSLDHPSFSRRVRTILFLIRGVGLDSKSLLDTWVSRYKYLRVLNLAESSFETLPKSIAKLEHLRVLNLSHNRKIKRLPRSICKLQNLLVLSLKECTELETLPKGLGKLISLRKLAITTKQHVLSENEFASLGNLQTLGFHRCDNLKFLLKGVQPASLKELIVRSCGSLESLPLYLLPQLQTLFVENCKILNLSLNNGSPIQKMRMRYLYLEDLPVLETLPPWIEGAADTLESLGIQNLPNFNMLPEWITTMTHIKRLYIADCPQLLSLPRDMHRLTALEHLYIAGCPELFRKCRPKSGEYLPIIAHIKRVIIREEN